MQVPTKNPGVGMQGMGNASAGPYADASHFGADNYRDLHNFGGAVQHAGNSLLAEAQQRKKREDDAFVRDTVNQAQTRYLEESKGIFGKSGVDAKGAPEEMDKLLQGMRKDLEKKLQNGNQRRAFENAWAYMSTDAQRAAILHRNKQMEVYEKQTHAAQNLTVSKKAAEAVLQPGGVDTVLNGPSLEVIRINTDALTEGQPEEARELARAQAYATFHLEQINSLATLGPEAVLDYLDRDKVKEAFSTAEWKGLKSKFSEALQNAKEGEANTDASLWAIEEYRKGTPLEDIQVMALRRYPDDPDRAKLAFVSAQTQANLVKESTAKEVAQKTEQAWNRFIDTGEIDPATPAKERVAMMKHEAWRATQEGGKAEPNDAFGYHIWKSYSREKLFELAERGELGAVFRELAPNGNKGPKSVFLDPILKKMFSDDGGGDKRPGTDTNKGWAIDRFVGDTGLIPASERDSKVLNDFGEKFEIAAADRARALKLAKADDLPEEEREKIYAKFRAKGSYNTSPILSRIPLVGRLWAPEEREYFDMLSDEEADFDAFTPFEATPTGETVESAPSPESAAPVPSPSAPPTAEDSGMVPVNATRFRLGMPKASPSGNTTATADTLPEPVLRRAGSKGNASIDPVEVTVEGLGKTTLYKITEAGKDGKISVYVDAAGNAVPPEKIRK